MTTYSEFQEEQHKQTDIQKKAADTRDSHPYKHDNKGGVTQHRETGKWHATGQAGNTFKSTKVHLVHKQGHDSPHAASEHSKKLHGTTDKSDFHQLEKNRGDHSHPGHKHSHYGAFQNDVSHDSAKGHHGKDAPPNSHRYSSRG